MKYKCLMAIGILVFLFHTWLAVDSLMAFLRMCEKKTDSVIIAAEGHFYFKNQALFDAITFTLLGIGWIGLIIFFGSNSAKSKLKSLSVVVLATIGVASIALFGDGIALLGVYPLAIGAAFAGVRFY